MFDTHCHLNSKYFDPTSLKRASLGAGGKVEDVIGRAKSAGVNSIVVPGTDLETSKKAVDLANEFENVFAAVGIHPHHIYQYQIEKSKEQNYKAKLKSELERIEALLSNKKVVAIGEVGVDRHYYKKTKYSNYEVTNEFISLQKEVLKKQIELAIKYQKSLILHNREAIEDFLEGLDEVWNKKLAGKTVFHCCEPDEKLLDWAKKHNVFIGVDGDITYDKNKRKFIKKVPLEMLVLETDSPFLTPEPLRSQKTFPNEPKNLIIIANFIAKLLNISVKRLSEETSRNANKLFGLN